MEENNILRVDEAGAITLPQHTLEHMGVTPGDVVNFSENTDNPEEIIIRKDNQHVMIHEDLINELQNLIDTGKVKEKTVEELYEKIVIDFCRNYKK